MRNKNLIWLLLLVMLAYSACKSKEKARKADKSRKADTEDVSSVLYSAWLDISELKAYKLERNVHLPGITQTGDEDEVVSVFNKNSDLTEFELSTTDVYTGNMANLGIPENFGNEMKYWLSFLPNPLLPHTFEKNRIKKLKALFTLTGEQENEPFLIYELNKEKFNELPESKNSVFENLKNIWMVFDTRNNNIREYHFEFTGDAQKLREHIIVFDDYKKEGIFTYPSKITRTTILNDRNSNQKNNVQQEIVENIRKIEDYRNKKESCSELSDPAARLNCRKKWDRAIETISVMNKMMAENIYTLEYDIRIKDVRMK